jgi:hypothetical protein
MKKLIGLLLAGWAVILSPGFRTVAAGDEGEIPLSKIDGTYAVTNQGSLFFCVQATAPFPPAACGSEGALGLRFTLLSVGAVTHLKTTSCSVLTQTYSDLPLDVTPPLVQVVHNVTTITSYDPVTGTGEASFTTYNGGQCNGASFDSTGATVLSTGTEHLAVSDRGKRIDFLITSLSSPEGAIGDFSISGIGFRH